MSSCAAMGPGSRCQGCGWLQGMSWGMRASAQPQHPSHSLTPSVLIVNRSPSYIPPQGRCILRYHPKETPGLTRDSPCPPWVGRPGRGRAANGGQVDVRIEEYEGRFPQGVVLRVFARGAYDVRGLCCGRFSALCMLQTRASEMSDAERPLRRLSMVRCQRR
jgi:hypothetical protein